MTKRFIPYGHQSIDESDIKAVVKVLRSDWLTQGPVVGQFEAALCKETGAKYAVAVANGTAALHLACLAAGIKPGDEVITTALTFVASSNAVLYCGAKPVFADVDPVTGCLDPVVVEKKITRRTKMIIPVHYAGLACDMSALKRIADRHGLLVLEDGAHALGTVYKGKPVGSCSHSKMTALSFHPVKHITTGEGGAVLTNDRKLYERVKQLRTHGITKDPQEFEDKADGVWSNEMQMLGFNYRITDFQCALGIAQVKKLKRFIAERRRIAAFYDKAFSDNPWFDLPAQSDGAFHSYHLYAIRLKPELVDRRREIFDALRQAGIGVQVHYMPVYRNPHYRRLGYRGILCPKAEQYYASLLSLPIYPGLTPGQMAKVAREVLAVCQKAGI